MPRTARSKPRGPKPRIPRIHFLAVYKEARRKPNTVNFLAEHFQISVSTVYSYINKYIKTLPLRSYNFTPPRKPKTKKRNPPLFVTPKGTLILALAHTLSKADLNKHYKFSLHQTSTAVNQYLFNLYHNPIHPAPVIPEPADYSQFQAFSHFCSNPSLLSPHAYPLLIGPTHLALPTTNYQSRESLSVYHASCSETACRLFPLLTDPICPYTDRELRAPLRLPDPEPFERLRVSHSSFQTPSSP